MTSAKSFVEKILKQYPVAVFSKAHCPYCIKAKTTLSSFNLNPDYYKIVELDGRNDMSEIQDYLKDITGGRTVPRVFINGQFFGGGDDTVAGKSTGILQKKLAEAGVVGK